MGFKVLLILAACVATTYAGVGIVTAAVEAEALALWNKFCDGDSEGGQDGGLTVYCKRDRSTVSQNLRHEASIGEAAPPQDQIIFIKPPSYHYSHDVVVKGGGVSARKTIIYVKPSKNTHEVKVQDETNPSEGAPKPQIFFLKGAHGGSESETASQPQTPPPAAYLPPPTKPPGAYLPPAKPSEGYNYEVPGNPLAYN